MLTRSSSATAATTRATSWSRAGFLQWPSVFALATDPETTSCCSTSPTRTYIARCRNSFSAASARSPPAPTSRSSWPPARPRSCATPSPPTSSTCAPAARAAATCSRSARRSGCWPAWARTTRPGFIKICTYFPYPAKVWLNGHEWAKRHADRRGHRLRRAVQRVRQLRAARDGCRRSATASPTWRIESSHQLAGGAVGLSERRQYDLDPARSKNHCACCGRSVQDDRLRAGRRAC